MENPLPIIAPHLPPLFGMITACTDINGDLLNSPSLGIFIPTTVQYENPLVASLALSRTFLNKQDDEEKKALSKTTALEALGFLTALLLDPLRFVEKRALFCCDN